MKKCFVIVDHTGNVICVITGAEVADLPTLMFLHTEMGSDFSHVLTDVDSAHHFTYIDSAGATHMCYAHEVAIHEIVKQIPDNGVDEAYGFNVNDVMNIANKMDKPLTRVECREVLALMLNKADVSAGIAWYTIEYFIDQWSQAQQC